MPSFSRPSQPSPHVSHPYRPHPQFLPFPSIRLSLSSRVWGAPVFTSSMNIVDLRQTSVRQLEPLLEEEARHWRDDLHWDYRGALELIKRFPEAHALAGSVAMENGSAVGYSFYVLEEQKGLIGGLYVSAKHPQAVIGRLLLEE